MAYTSLRSSTGRIIYNIRCFVDVHRLQLTSAYTRIPPLIRSCASTQIKSPTRKTCNVDYKNVISPILDKDVLQNIQSIVGLRVAPTDFTWAHMDRSFSLESWKNIQLPYDKGYDVHECYEMAKKCISELPMADFYLIETEQSSLKRLSYISHTLTRVSLESMIVCMLNQASNHPRLLTMKPSAVTSLFKLSVGGERVSGQNIVDSLLEGSYKDFPQVVATSDMINIYEKKHSVPKEYMSNTLLLTVAFFHLLNASKS